MVVPSESPAFRPGRFKSVKHRSLRSSGRDPAHRFDIHEIHNHAGHLGQSRGDIPLISAHRVAGRYRHNDRRSAASG